MRLVIIFIALWGFIIQLYSQTANTPAMELKSTTYSYLLYKPDGYSEINKKWPLIIYLHGRSACGNNLAKVRRYGMPFYLDRGMKIDAICIAPQCPAGKNWVSENWFLPFISELKNKYSIDENRIYLTGMSLGGFGAFSLAIKYPEIFAAVAPLCGGGQPATVCPMKDIPTWVFHGDRDEQVPLYRSTEMVEALRKCGGNPKYTILKGQPHDIHKTYGNIELYEWMLQQNKGLKIKNQVSQPINDSIRTKEDSNVLNKTIIKKNKRKKPVKKLRDEEYETIRVDFK